jgi:hypothetical protein
MVEDIWGSGFLDDVGMVGLDVGYDLCFTEVSAVFCLCEVLATTNHWHNACITK